MDGRDGAVALNVRQMLSPPRAARPPFGTNCPSPAVGDAARASKCAREGTDPATDGSASLLIGSPYSSVSTKDHLRERLVIAEARVAAAASSKARAQHMAAHLRDILSPQKM